MPDAEASEKLPNTDRSGFSLQLYDISVRLPDIAAKLDELTGEKRELAPTWLKSPVLVAVATAVFGLLGTGIGALLQGYWNTKLERQKFEAALIQTALESGEKQDVARNLVFLLDTGIIQSLDRDKIAAAAAEPSTLPVSFGISHGAVRSGQTTITDAKRILSQLGLYNGALDDVDSQAFRDAVRVFQKQRDMPPDGVLGPLTLAALREAVTSQPEPRQ